MNKKYKLPPTFQINFENIDRHTCLLSTSQILNIHREKAFSFFENPENLFEITPDWLDFRFNNRCKQNKTFEGAEFDYTIRWLGIRMKWHTIISEYFPPERFIDVQVKGPYAIWRHLHIFEPSFEGTLMRDFVTYRVHFSFLGSILHRVVIKKQLQDIFSYRAVRIDEWSKGIFRSKLITRSL